MGYSEFEFEDRGGLTGGGQPEEGPLEREDSSPADSSQPPFPEPVLKLEPEEQTEFLAWLDEWILQLEATQQPKLTEFAEYEKLYRARGAAAKTFPFEGACADEIPVVAMAVDPIHARLETTIFKNDPVFKLKALKKSFLPYVAPVENWLNFYMKNIVKFRSVASPRILESAKLGSMVFKTVYDVDEGDILTYERDADGDFEVVKKKQVRFKGPRPIGISLGDFLFPASYQHLQDCPIVAERQRVSYNQLKVQEASGKLANCDQIYNASRASLTALESARETAANHQTSLLKLLDDLIVWEVWCEYDINGDGMPEHLVATYHPDTRTILRLQYNWYFHQLKPYTLIPYTVTNDSLYGLGIAEMTAPFQKAITRWHQMASDNAYIANIRMFVVKQGSKIEEVPRLYPGRCFFVEDPKSDFLPFKAGEIYPSTLQERQNLFGMVEKRTGVSDYLTGRESPVIGSRATATSTIALIQEGTKRVEEVLENIREGFGEIVQMMFWIWIQYGLDGMDDLVFGDDEIGQKVHEFFEVVAHKENVNGALAIDLGASDASGNRQAQQQMQLAIINVMMGYYEKFLQAGQMAIQGATQGIPQLTMMVADVTRASHELFKDLLVKYDIRNPEDYLPDLEGYLGGLLGGGTGAGTGSPSAEPGVAGGGQVLPGQGASGAGGTGESQLIQPSLALLSG